MATVQEAQNADIRDTFTPHAAAPPPEIKIISHSNIFYWWPAWVAGFAVALISYVQGRDVAVVSEFIDRVQPSNNPGIFFIAVLVLLVVFTTTKLRGIYSVVTVVTVAFFVDSVRVVRVVGRHPAFCPPHLGAREHGLLPVVLNVAADRLAARVSRVRSLDHLARPPGADDRGAADRWPSAQL